MSGGKSTGYQGNRYTSNNQVNQVSPRESGWNTQGRNLLNPTGPTSGPGAPLGNSQPPQTSTPAVQGADYNPMLPGAGPFNPSPQTPSNNTPVAGPGGNMNGQLPSPQNLYNQYANTVFGNNNPVPNNPLNQSTPTASNSPDNSINSAQSPSPQDLYNQYTNTVFGNNNPAPNSPAFNSVNDTSVQPNSSDQGVAANAHQYIGKIDSNNNLIPDNSSGGGKGGFGTTMPGMAGPNTFGYGMTAQQYYNDPDYINGGGPGYGEPFSAYWAGGRDITS